MNINEITPLEETKEQFIEIDLTSKVIPKKKKITEEKSSKKVIKKKKVVPDNVQLS